MANPYHHSISSVNKWGGNVDDYIAIHSWFDESKAWHGDYRHRAMRHHTQGIFDCEHRFGTTITLSTGRVIPTRWVAEQHVVEDLGYMPTVSDWLKHLSAEDAPWMHRSRRISEELKEGSND